MEREIKVHPNFDASYAARFVQAAGAFESHISIVHGEKTANAKSIMGIISLDLHAGGTIKIAASGKDEAAAIEKLANLLVGEA